MNEQWRIYIRDLGNPGSKDKRTKVHGSYDDMTNRANYLNRQMARTHGDGRYHAYIAPDNGSNNMQTNTEQTTPTLDRYYLYDDIGRPMGIAGSYEEAREKCDEHEGWTMVAVQ